jgi:phytanoyl-CoA hydroxylase
MATVHERRTTAANLTTATIEAYRRQGFVHVPGVISREEAEHYRAVASGLAERIHSHHQGSVFTQLVNVWPQDEEMKQLTFHPNIAAIAERLAGVPLRLWHDQVLIKAPHKSTPTEFHQDQPYWPHANSTHPLSAWIALVDVPVERGCMTFLPGSHTHTELGATDITDAGGVFGACPEFAWFPRVTLPLRAGDCTFHHARCVHGATPNLTDEPRVAHVVIFMDATATYTGKKHVVTDPLRLTPGQPFDAPDFPRVNE